ncbi:DnaJ-domain-containing protein [Armillaria novae-zelandiae]|uniref:DnaJ-domain-containing protein n=1 Tax=Armillaria novae-zelandiae TaxID=153914 RepID=A0AA39UIH4_9AGAR|nr:DnaJ-domain-containing protein [Armillaria novae-zelandiae]
MPGTLYDILGVPTNATPEEVRRAYKQKALETHPDKLDPGSSDDEKQAAKAQFYKVQEALEVLSDPVKRTHYNVRMRIVSRGFQPVLSEEHARRLRERDAWVKQQKEVHETRLKEIRERNQQLKVQAESRLREAEERGALVQKMLEEMDNIHPEWRERKQNVLMRRAARLSSASAAKRAN